jgi:hypothetical protein
MLSQERCLVHRIVLKDLPVVETLNETSLKQVVGGAYDAFRPGQSSPLFMKLNAYAPANDPSLVVMPLGGAVKVGSWSWSQSSGGDAPTERLA